MFSSVMLRVSRCKQLTCSSSWAICTSPTQQLEVRQLNFFIYSKYVF
jgi:hypothetical protein